MIDYLSEEGDYRAPAKGRLSLYALFSLAAERTRTYGGDDEEASLGPEEEGILSLGKAASMQVASDNKSSSPSKNVVKNSPTFFDAVSKDPNLSLNACLLAKRRSWREKACAVEEADTVRKPWRATNDFHVLHRKSALCEEYLLKSARTLSPTKICGGADNDAKCVVNSETGFRRRGRTSAPQSPKHHRSPIKNKTNRLHGKNTQKSFNSKSVLRQGYLWGLYELRSDDSGHSDQIDISRPTMKHTLPYFSSATNKAIEGNNFPMSSRDSSVRWISSSGKANKSSSSLQLPMRFISPTSSVPKRRIGAQIERLLHSKDKRETLRTPLAGMDLLGL
jgi:hypothetical protein